MADEASNLEQGFNEEELEDIMNEIESLESEFSEDEETPEKEGDNVVELRTNDEPAAEEPVAKEAAPVKEPQAAKKVTQTSSKVSGATTEMDFNVSGDLNLKLNFKIGDNSVALHLAQGEGLVIEMENGAKFTVPFSFDSKKSA